MIDIERTLEDLKILNDFCHGTVLDDAIELLKDREPVEAELEGGGSNWWYVCGECHGAIDDMDSYCRHCGRKVKWNA